MATRSKVCFTLTPKLTHLLQGKFTVKIGGSGHQVGLQALLTTKFFVSKMFPHDEYVVKYNETHLLFTAQRILSSSVIIH